MSQTRLTKEQVDKFYADYVRSKTKGNYAGEVMEKSVWKANVELLLNEDATGVNWSNTEIRKASHLIARGDAWSRKQVKTLLHNMSKESFAETRAAMEAHFGTQNIEKLITQNQGAVFQFLKGYSNNWQEYFNS